MEDKLNSAYRFFKKKEENKRQYLKKAIERGENSGLSTPFDNEAFKREMLEKYSEDS